MNLMKRALEMEELLKDELKLKEANKYRFEREIEATFKENFIQRATEFIDTYQKEHGELDHETINILYRFAREL